VRMKRKICWFRLMLSFTMTSPASASAPGAPFAAAPFAFAPLVSPRPLPVTGCSAACRSLGLLGFGLRGDVGGVAFRTTRTLRPLVTERPQFVEEEVRRHRHDHA